MTTSNDSNAGVTSLRHSSRAKKPSQRAEEMRLAEKVGERLDSTTKKATSGGEKKVSGKKGANRKKKEVAHRKDSPSKDEDDGGEYEQDEEASEDEEEIEEGTAEGEDKNGEVEDGAEPEVFCLCRKGDDGRPMVFCAECSDWFHFKCVNLSKKVAEMLSEYICPPCSDRTGKQSKNIDDQERSEASASPFQDDSEHSSSPARRPSGPTKRKSMEEDGMRKRSRGDSPLPVARKSSNSISQSGSRPAETSRKTSMSGSAPIGSTGVMKARSETLRKHAVDQLKSTFDGIFAEVIKDEAERNTTVEKYAVEFEETLFDAHSENIPKTTLKTAGKMYRDRLRSYLFNLKDKGNTALRQKIASGELPASELAVMGNDELANDEIRKEVERRKRENLEQSILKKEKAPLRKLTHKGEIDIEYETTQNSRVAEEQRDHVDKQDTIPMVEKGSDSGAMSPPAVPRTSAVQASPTSATHPRRLPTTLQSPTTYNFDNVWTAADASQEPVEDALEDEKDKDIMDAGTVTGKDSNGDGIIAETASEEKADDFIDGFLGMTDVTNDDVKAESDEQQGLVEESDEDIKWRGAISMPEEGICTGKIRQIAGRVLQPNDWSALFPSSHSIIEGRLPSASAAPYLEQSRLTLRTELVVLTMQSSWEPESLKEAPSGGPTSEAENEANFASLLSYFVRRDRYGVLPPHPTARGKLVKDFYIAPLSKESRFPHWLDLCMKEDGIEGADMRRDNDMFVIVVVLFRQTSHQQSDRTAFSPPQNNAVNVNNGSGTPPTSNLNAVLGAGGSDTLQNLLKAVGSNIAPNLALVNQTSQSTTDGQHPSIEALSEMPKPQLEDMLQKNPTLVDELLKTLAGNKSASPRPPGPPPGPPPPQPPPGVYGSGQHATQSSQYVNNPYVNNYQQQHHMQRPNPPSGYASYGGNYGNAGMPPARPMQPQGNFSSQHLPGGADQGWHQNPNYYGRPAAGYASPPGNYGPPVRGGNQRPPQGAYRRN